MLLLDGVPAPFMRDFKGPQVHLDLHLEPAPETFWHSPRVPAGATSAIFELVCHQHVSLLIDDLELTFRSTPVVPAEVRLVFLCPAASEDQADRRGPGRTLLHIRLDDERRPQLDRCRVARLDREELKQSQTGGR